MAEIDNLANEEASESDDDSEGQGIKNAYSVEDLLGELESEGDEHTTDSVRETSTAQSEGVQLLIEFEPKSVEAPNALLAEFSCTPCGGDRIENTDGHPCNSPEVQQEKRLQSGDHTPAGDQQQSSDLLSFSADNVEGQLVSESCTGEECHAPNALEKAVLIGDTYSLTYDEVPTENIYQDPFDDNDGKRS